MNTTIKTLDGESQRVTLPNAHWTGKQEINTGIYAVALYSGKKSGRKFIETLSLWINGNGGNTGYRTTEITESAYINFCEKIGTEPMHVTIVDES